MTVTASYLLGISVIGLHEAGHLASAAWFGINIKRIGLSWKGIYIVREPGPLPANMMTTLAGPFLNLALAATWPWARDFALINLIFGLSNLLPFAGSDGERFCKILRNGCRESGVEPSRWIAQRLGLALTTLHL